MKKGTDQNLVERMANVVEVLSRAEERSLTGGESQKVINECIVLAANKIKEELTPTTPTTKRSK